MIFCQWSHYYIVIICPVLQQSLLILNVYAVISLNQTKLDQFDRWYSASGSIILWSVLLTHYMPSIKRIFGLLNVNTNLLNHVSLFSLANICWLSHFKIVTVSLVHRFPMGKVPLVGDYDLPNDGINKH